MSMSCGYSFLQYALWIANASTASLIMNNADAYDRCEDLQLFFLLSFLRRQ